MTTPAVEGDGVVVLHFDAATRRWKALVAGSAIECQSIGMPPSVGAKLRHACYKA